jgi:uncharacterized protein (TIGR02569 family)
VRSLRPVSHPSPPASVLHAFGVEAPAVPLAGGQGGAFRAGPYVLKPAADTDEVAWSGEILADLPQRGFRTPRYVQSGLGAWTVDGWFAQEFVDGSHAADRWTEVLGVCDAFHRALAGIARPDFMARRTNPWCVADLMAWEEIPLVHGPALAPLVAPLAERLAPVTLPDQVIHGDFTENVLFGPQPPAVIDFTPYYRPALFARAIVVVDAVTWRGADVALLDPFEDEPEGGQMLLRAELRRLLEIDQQFQQFGRDRYNQAPAHRPLVERLLSRETA